MKKIILTTLLLFITAATAMSQQIPETEFEELPQELYTIPQEFQTAKVLEVKNTDDCQQTTLEILNGVDSGKILNINYGEGFRLYDSQKVKPGEKVVLTQGEGFEGNTVYSIMDKYRLNWVIIVVAFFFAVAIFFGRLKGVSSILGLCLSLVVLIYFIIPNILNGYNPILISLIGSVLIALSSIYLAHGFSKRTTLALISTLISLVISIVLALLFVELTKLTGTASEETFFLQLNQDASINLKGLLLGGIIIGSLGVLDDITTGQTAAVDEIYKANNGLTRSELYKSGLSVGKAHIASIVNTLVLAYAGASFPLLVLFSMDNPEPLWVLMNQEFIVEEIVRTLVGTTALIFAVPITTFLAANYYSKQSKAFERRLQR
ncbi:YibE/F family protein [Candidatus Peregrinibacteria bacterium]|nr:YibE/F family protein [Candidatus Peregrinibacteria bacterium]